MRAFRVAFVLVFLLTAVVPAAQAQQAKLAPTSAVLATTSDCVKYTSLVPWGNSKFQTFPRLGLNGSAVLQYPDFSVLGPDVIALVAVDYPGILGTGFKILQDPPGAYETRVGFVLQPNTNLDYVTLDGILGGDVFFLYKFLDYGSFADLDNMLECHLSRTARAHQRVVKIGDIGLAEQQWPNERDFFYRITLCQFPGRPELGINECDFVRDPKP